MQLNDDNDENHDGAGLRIATIPFGVAVAIDDKQLRPRLLQLPP